MADEPRVRILTQEEFDREYGGRDVRIREPDSLDRFLNGVYGGVSMHTLPVDEFGESSFSDRLPRTTGEAAGALGTLGAAAYGLSRLPSGARRGPIGWLARLAQRGVENVAERPGRAAAVAASGVATSGLGAAALPEVWDSPYAEPVGGLLGGVAEIPIRGGARLVGSTMANILRDPSIRAAPRRVARAVDILEDTAGTRLNPDQIDEATSALRGRLGNVGMGDPEVTLGQVTRNPNIAALEMDAARGRGPVPEGLQGVRDAQNRALNESAFPRNHPQAHERTMEIVGRDALNTNLNTARTAMDEAYGALPNSRVAVPRVFEEVNNMLARRDAAEFTSQLPRNARMFIEDIRRGAFDRNNGTVGLRNLITHRNQLDDIIRKPGADPTLVERATAMRNAIDESIGADQAASGTYSRYSTARDSVNEANSALRSDIAKNVVDSPVAFRDLARMVGNRHDAVELARDVIEQRLRNSVTGANGQFNGQAMGRFLSDRSNTSLMEAAFGHDHVRRLREIAGVADDLVVPVPAGRESSALRQFDQAARSGERRFTSLFPAPLNRYSPFGYARMVAREIAHDIGSNETVVMRNLLRDALTDPDVASLFVRQTQNRRAERSARVIRNLATRYAEPAADSERIGREREASGQTGVMDSAAGAAGQVLDSGRQAVDQLIQRFRGAE